MNNLENTTSIENVQEFVRNATQEFLVQTIINYKNQFTDSQETINSQKSTIMTQRNEINRIKSIVEEFIKEGLDECTDDEALTNLAEELDIELTKTIKVSFIVECSAEVTVPYGYSEDDIENNIDVDITFSDSDIDGDIDSNIERFRSEEI